MRAYRKRRRVVLEDIEAAWQHVLDANRAVERVEAENRRLAEDIETIRRQLQAARREAAELRRRLAGVEADRGRTVETHTGAELNRAERRRLERAERSHRRS